MKKEITCPNCGHAIERYENPLPTADVIVERGEKIVLVRRKNAPLGWAIPGGFIDYGESAEAAAIREIREETGIEVENLLQFQTYSHPERDPRFHTITVVFTARGLSDPVPGDDAAEAALFGQRELPTPLVFDHALILEDYFRAKANAGRRELCGLMPPKTRK